MTAVEDHGLGKPRGGGRVRHQRAVEPAGLRHVEQERDRERKDLTHLGQRGDGGALAGVERGIVREDCGVDQSAAGGDVTGEGDVGTAGAGDAGGGDPRGCAGEEPEDDPGPPARAQFGPGPEPCPTHGVCPARSTGRVNHMGVGVRRVRTVAQVGVLARTFQ